MVALYVITFHIYYAHDPTHTIVMEQSLLKSRRCFQQLTTMARTNLHCFPAQSVQSWVSFGDVQNAVYFSPSCCA